ncbi:MAG: xylan 1,4-beta-xylosidase [Chloroflexi bacterium]|nr:xylan 1,4-beta-xylosidase [Chloroflexota bacterium]
MTDIEQTARADWEARIGLRSDADAGLDLPRLAAPAALHADGGRGQVTLDWEPVEGAAGYIIERSASTEGPWELLVIGEPEVRPVPHPPFTDTSGEPGRETYYRVAASASVKDFDQPRSEVVKATPVADGDAGIKIDVDAASSIGPVDRPWRPIIGSEHLSQLEAGIGPGGRPIGAEFSDALRMAHDELRVEAVRAHAILNDDLGTYREVDGQPVHDFSGIDRIYDHVLGLGLRPIVELGFMPRDLASDDSKTVFDYAAIISPPRDWEKWEALIRELTAHLVDRYGLAEVRRWAFEVWNEANLEVFWSGTRDEYLRLYDVSVRAVKSVDASLIVGGPASAAGKWVDDLLVHCAATGSPIDFVSTHTYGNAPLDLRPIAARHGFPGLPQWWTEWGAHATHFNPVHDSPWSAAYLVRGMASAMGRTEALAYWTISDHFEELGRPPRLLHGGFGLLAVGNLRKPRWWGLWMLEQLLPERVAVAVTGDGAGDMVQAIGSRADDGRVTVLVWNGTVDVSKARGDPLLDRETSLTISGLTAAHYRLHHRRLDEVHSNLARAWADIGGTADWPDEDQWQELAARNHLEDLEEEQPVEITDGSLELAFDLPMPSVSLLELEPVRAP